MGGGNSVSSFCRACVCQCELTEFGAQPAKFSPLKQYSRNGIPEVRSRPIDWAFLGGSARTPTIKTVGGTGAIRTGVSCN